ncbi:MAG: conjugal transfer protein TraC [Candidatus Ryanbacteria bacterium RIFCSPHIGHO2_02_FULL_45_43]|uniref:Conjugal transfer protein TraC n=1 Tax=Candidatus Ryanbacteria bacterium RIFCSPHIGHO2_01_45_13 TaxID=1802112 RepID=A0A1G2FXI8_9BACT|nr:MAG: conjugal transfer protein TraC [Candidatus Ryanbacteria bacterium RIFCSPHIGHO2_01_FULL_44_130]OGZ42537.1 MAG: conjugal transfer protein TraC [Candidatus Ryanbacteria bacterium RIFCSPHIGHO2_01_45_13]OGZ48214.1 MAG: conjugal transfer protein TraC [Candidatus Ryanbacteria bacterium RIFCSPHIGHO2_02_FULL_45_43]OGZ49990.1 MAG: conjugal transfer protein TraC [Candidatus Ryanbacteria bacterium RIFCSPHIGHO2_12_FULL_44_20]OGZ51449.1 MAG: conjugal transfer protein TraC [Candidatus Ryanbacteria bac
MALFRRAKKAEAEQMLPIYPQEIFEAGLLDLKDVLAPSAFEVSPSDMRLGQKFVQTIFVFSYPRFLATNWFSGVLNLDKEFDVSLFVHPVDTAMMLRRLRKKVAEVQSQITEREEKGLVRDPMLDTAYRDLEDLRDKLMQAREHLFSFGLYITIYADSKRDLEKTASLVRSMLDARLVLTKPALFQQKEGLNSVFPLAMDQLNVNNYMNSAPLSSVFPFTSFDLTSNKGILFGINRHNSSLVLFDRFSFENYNSVVFAKSGSGKSYTAKLEILRSLMLDTDVIVIDPEREYEYLAETVGGRYFNIALTSKHHINPFDLPPPREDESPTDILRSHVISLVGLFRIMLGGLTPEEDAILDRSINETYASKDITPETDFSKKPPPLLSDLELVLASMVGAESLAIRLRKFTTGTWGGFINQHTNVDVHNQLVVFSVRDMEDELRPVAMYLIVQFVWGAIRREMKKRLLVVDEAWWIMKTEDGASFLYGLAKRARKYYLGLATITQDVADFMGSPYGKPIITNSSIQMLLKQSPGTIDVVQKTFNLTEEEKFLLLESDVGEGIFFAGLKHVAIKIIASYTEHQIITSDPSELLAIKKAKEEYMANKGGNV